MWNSKPLSVDFFRKIRCGVPLWLSGLRIGGVTAVVQVAAVVWVPSLAWNFHMPQA